MRAKTFLLLVVFAVASAHEPVTTKLTWSAEISRILYARCSGCHRDGGSAPMALTDYESVRPWAKAIRDEVLSRRMPPWGAVKGFGDFRNDSSLTQDEIQRVAEWVEGGAPEGDPRYLPRSLPGPPTRINVPRGTTSKRAKKLWRKSVVVGLRVLDGNDGARLVAKHPDGAIQPLIWVVHGSAARGRVFLYREPLMLPAGTALEGSVKVELLVKPPRRAR